MGGVYSMGFGRGMAFKGLCVVSPWVCALEMGLRACVGSCARHALLKAFEEIQGEDNLTGRTMPIYPPTTSSLLHWN